MKPRHPEPVYAPVIPREPPADLVGAACAGVDPDLWYPEKGGSNVRPKEICGGCAVKAACLVHGLAEAHGIWGGLSAKERSRLRNGRAA